jgi:hypothetical protein
MTWKQWVRRLFITLWHRCATIAADKVAACGSLSPESAKAWEDFLLRCEKRALDHATAIPGLREEEKS